MSEIERQNEREMREPEKGSVRRGRRYRLVGERERERETEVSIRIGPILPPLSTGRRRWRRRRDVTNDGLALESERSRAAHNSTPSDLFSHSLNVQYAEEQRGFETQRKALEHTAKSQI